LDIYERLAAQDPTSTQWQSDLGRSHHDIGTILELQDNRKGALNEYRISLAISERLAAQTPTHSDLQRDFAIDLLRVGTCLIDLNELESGRSHLHRSLSILDDLLGRTPAAPGFLPTLVRTSYALAKAEAKPNPYWQRTVDALTALMAQQLLDAEEQRILTEAQFAVGMSTP
jgi:hypothetical protein